MPLLHEETFKPLSLPENIKPDEEVFVCQFTNEVFRNYDDFFARVLLCKSPVWSCQYTGQDNLTFSEALKSEEDFVTTLSSIQICHKKAMLSIVHHSLHTNFNSLIKEVFMYFKERYIAGEELEYHSMNGSKKLTKTVKVLEVIRKQSSPPQTDTTPSVQPQSSSDPKPQVNDDSSLLNGSHLLTTPTKQSSVKSTPVSSPSRSLDVSCLANDYSYVIQLLDGSGKQLTTLYHNLSRPRKSLTKDKIKVFLKNALQRDSDKSPYLVKPKLIEEFHLGSSPVVHNSNKSSVTPSVTSSVGSLEKRKRTTSQTSLDSFFAPSDSKKKSHPLKPILYNPLIESTPKITPKLPKKKLSKGSASRRNSSTKKNSASKSAKTNSKDSEGRPTPFKSITPKVKKTSPGLAKEVKKILKRSKSLKQLDVRKNLVKKDKRASVDSVLMERRKSFAELKAQRLAERERQKERAKEARLNRARELREKRKMEKLEQLEKMKPREDELCEDSKPLPLVHPMPVSSNALFPEIVTIMEFLHHYGSAFNISDVIPNGITYDKLEHALNSCSTETILFDLVKFLLQAIFSAMTEEHEDSVETSTVTVATTSKSSNKEESENGSTTGASGSRRSSVGSIPVEGLEDQENRQDLASVTLSSIKLSAQEHAMWSLQTQASTLQNLALNVCTCSEVLRLHLMSCGGYTSNSERQWFRFCNRGGFTESDDPVVELRLSHPGVISALSSRSFFDMEPKDKALILSVLCYQLLMFSCSREAMEEIFTKSKQIRKQLRELRVSIAGNKKKSNKQVKEDEQGENPPREKRSASEEKAAKQEEEQRKAQVNEEISQLECELYPLNAAVCLRPLGIDRYYNKYWVFPSLPGLYIEHFVDNEHNNQSPKAEQQSTAHEEGPSDPSSVPIVSHDQVSHDQVSHDLSLQCESSWSLVSSDECFQALLSSLNPLGLRESNLKASLERLKGMVSESISNCPFLDGKLSDKSTVADSGYRHGDDCLELQLREQILDLEEKLYLGNLGYVRGTCERKEWREKIENSGAARVYAITNGEIVHVQNDDGGNDQGVQEEDSVSELAEVLLQIQLGIEKKNLLSPLGTAVDTKNKGGKYARKNASTTSAHSQPLCVDKWRESLQKSTSLSQIFIHLSTLERSVAWSKSLMNVRCRLCRRKGGDEYMLLCDGCDHGYHTYCLRPPLTIIPDGDWFCNDCCPVTPVKRRRTVSMVSLKELSDSESEESAGSDEDTEQDEYSDNSDEDSMDESKHKLRASTRIQSKQYHTRGAKPRPSPPVTIATNTTRGRKRLKLDEESRGSSSDRSSQAEMIISAIIDLRCCKNSKASTTSQHKAEETLEGQLCKALLKEIMEHTDSWPFLNPVRRREFPDYHDIISKPMDLKTIKHNITTHKYNGLNDFLRDINQVFDNCSTYHKRHSKIGKAGASLRRFVEQRYSDLGIGNLASVTVSGMKNTPDLRSSAGI